MSTACPQAPHAAQIKCLIPSLNQPIQKMSNPHGHEPPYLFKNGHRTQDNQLVTHHVSSQKRKTLGVKYLQ
jgi:hypothetical protein